MINYLWAIFIIVGFIFSVISGNSNITDTFFTSGSKTIDMILNLVPLLCLWLGTMKIAEVSGLLDIISKKHLVVNRKLHYFFRIFPSKPITFSFGPLKNAAKSARMPQEARAANCSLPQIPLWYALLLLRSSPRTQKESPWKGEYCNP